MKLWAIPIEAVRQGATLDGAITLCNLAALQAQLAPTVTAELGPEGWVAAVIYTRPGFPKRAEVKHIALAWHPVENAAPAGQEASR